MLWPHHGVLIYHPDADNNTITDSYITHTGNGVSNYADAGSTNYVVNTVFSENEDGVVILSKEKADRVRVWERLSEAHEADADNLDTLDLISKLVSSKLPG